MTPQRLTLYRRRFFSQLRYRGPVSPHFDGRRFRNLVPTQNWSREVFRWLFTRRPEAWPSWLDEPTGPVPAARLDTGRVRATFVNHSTVLLQIDGLNVLTDPVYSRRVGPFPWAGAPRVRDPGVRFDDLPKIDVILLSHDHYDHLDIRTMRRLAERDAPRLLCGLGVDRTLAIDGLPGAEALDWWQSAQLSPRVRATFTPSRHFSGRGLFDQDATLWGAFLVQTTAGNVYFAGDTGYGPHFKEVRERFGPIELALLPIGCYEPRWFMRTFHMSPEDAVLGHQDLGARLSIGIHHGTFRLGDESLERPRIDLEAAKAKAGIGPGEFVVIPAGGHAETGLASDAAPQPSEVVLSRHHC